MTVCLPVKQWGVHTLSAVEPGLPVWQLPDFTAISMKEAVTISLSVAVVIMAETLLAENNFAQKNGYKINDNQEIFAFSMGNLAAALTGCCPVNGSVSRTAMGEQYQARTQLASVVAGVSMLVLLLFGTGFVGYLPVPVLTAIVISALLGATEFHLAVRLWKISRTECFIFIGAFVGVLFFGNHQRSADRGDPVFYRDDPAHSQTGYLLSGDPAGPQTFQRSAGGQANFRSGRSDPLPL